MTSITTSPNSVTHTPKADPSTSKMNTMQLLRLAVTGRPYEYRPRNGRAAGTLMASRLIASGGRCFISPHVCNVPRKYRVVRVGDDRHLVPKFLLRIPVGFHLGVEDGAAPTTRVVGKGGRPFKPAVCCNERVCLPLEQQATYSLDGWHKGGGAVVVVSQALWGQRRTPRHDAQVHCIGRRPLMLRVNFTAPPTFLSNVRAIRFFGRHLSVGLC